MPHDRIKKRGFSTRSRALRLPPDDVGGWDGWQIFSVRLTLFMVSSVAGSPRAKIPGLRPRPGLLHPGDPVKQPAGHR